MNQFMPIAGTIHKIVSDIIYQLSIKKQLYQTKQQNFCKSIKNLRENLDSLSLDSFVATTIETLMQIERDEYLENIDNPKVDKGDGSYKRTLKTLSNNSLFVHVPRTRSGLFSPATLEILKINREKVDEIALSLYKK